LGLCAQFKLWFAYLRFFSKKLQNGIQRSVSVAGLPVGRMSVTNICIFGVIDVGQIPIAKLSGSQKAAFYVVVGIGVESIKCLCRLKVVDGVADGMGEMWGMDMRWLAERSQTQTWVIKHLFLTKINKNNGCVCVLGIVIL
jgi:hypothetical protein